MSSILIVGVLEALVDIIEDVLEPNKSLFDERRLLLSSPLASAATIITLDGRLWRPIFGCEITLMHLAGHVRSPTPLKEP